MGGRSDRQRRPGRRASVLACALALASTLLATIPADPASGAGQPGFVEFVGYWPLGIEDQDAMVVDDIGEHVVSIANASSGTDFDVIVYDGDGHELGRTTEALALAGARTGPGSPVVAAFQPGTQTLYTVAYPPHVATRATSTGARLVGFDISDPANIRKVSNHLISAFPTGIQPFGLGFDVDAQHLYIVGQAVPTLSRAFNVYVGEFKWSGQQAADPTIPQPLEPTLPPVPVRGCQRVIAGRQPAAIANIGDTVFVGCAPTSDPTSTIPVGSTSSIQEVALRKPDASRSHYLAGTYVTGESFVDLDAGDAGRLVLVGSAPARPGQAVWIFDLAHRSMVGQIAADDIMAAGIDTRSGWSLVAAKEAIIIGSDRGFPPPGNLPPIAIKDFQDAAGNQRFQQAVNGQVTPIPFRRTMLVPVLPKGEAITKYAIFRDITTDRHLIPGQPTDYRALDAEETGSNVPNLAGDAQAFGFRAHVIGGLSNVRSNLDGANPNWWNNEVGGPNSSTPTPKDITGIDDGDRDLHFSRIIGASLSQDESAARAINLDSEERTKSDWYSLTQRFNHFAAQKFPFPEPDPSVQGDPWPFDLAQCGVFARGTGSDEGESADWAAGPPASVSCNMDDPGVVADAEIEGIDPVGLAQLVTVGASSTHSELRRTPSGGIEVETHAEARNVIIGGQIEIGRIASTAVARAFGGHKDLAGNLVSEGAAEASYSRTFENVRSGDFSCGECDATEVLEEITAVLGAQVRVELPAFEELETEQGAHAHAWREPWALRQDVLVNKQVETQREIPALRIMIIADLDLPSRIILEFAGTKAEATHYRTREVPPDPVFDLDPIEDGLFETIDEVDLPAVLGEPPVSRTITVGGRTQAVTTESAAPIGETTGNPSFLEQLLESGGTWVRRSLAALAMTFALFSVFGTGPFLASRRRLLTKVASRKL